MMRKIANYFKTQSVLKAWLFGSYSRGEERPDSDVDILITLDKQANVGLFKLSSMQLDLQDLLQKPVDLVTDKGLLLFARETADMDKILFYEKVPLEKLDRIIFQITYRLRNNQTSCLEKNWSYGFSPSFSTSCFISSLS